MSASNREGPDQRRALVTGWFSFEQMGASAGDLMAHEVVLGWLDRLGIDYDVAITAKLGSGIQLETAIPGNYSDLIFVCGPLGNGEPITSLFEQFSHARIVSIDNSMLQHLDEWNPFDLLLERDSSRTARPDLAFLASNPSVPVVGLVLVHPQKEYRDGRHAEVHATMRALLGKTEVAVVAIDTCLDPENQTGLRTPAEIEALIARMDVVLTTRLHGLVLSLKNGVPVIAVDPIAGGAKIQRQAEALDWPFIFVPESLTDESLASAFEDVLRPETRVSAQQCADNARRLLTSTEQLFLDRFANLPSSHRP